MTLSPGLPRPSSAHLHSYIWQVLDTRPKPATQSTQGPVLSLNPLAYHMASGQVYDPCDFLYYRRLTQPWIFTLEGETLTYLCLFPSWEKHMNPNRGGQGQQGWWQGRILHITQSYLWVVKQESQ